MYFAGCPDDTLLKCPEAAQSEGHEVKGNPNRPFSMIVYVHSTLSDHTFTILRLGLVWSLFGESKFAIPSNLVLARKSILFKYFRRHPNQSRKFHTCTFILLPASGVRLMEPSRGKMRVGSRGCNRPACVSARSVRCTVYMYRYDATCKCTEKGQ